MNKRKIFAGALILIAGLFLLSAPCVLAQDVCEGNFDCDQDVDGTDAFTFKEDFGRSVMGNPCPNCPPPARLPKTGQTTSYFMSDDGELEKGVAWPYPRFTDHGDGTLTDNLTGFVWLKNADCFGQRTWSLALSDVWALSSGDCGLQDGSNAFDWRVPNRFELESLLALEYNSPTLCDMHGDEQWIDGDRFNNVRSNAYWSSTTVGNSPAYAFTVSFHSGFVSGHPKTNEYFVWPVRDPF